MQTAEQIQKVAVTLPDGSVRDYDAPVTGLQIAASIGKRLAKAALAVKIDGNLRDLTTSITTDAAVEIVTARPRGCARPDPPRRAHVMAEAVQELYPGTQVTIGPAIENGFYYDFARDEPFTPEDLAQIEARMRRDRRRATSRSCARCVTRDEAIALLRGHRRALQGRADRRDPGGRGRSSLYHQGDWLDLCRGPHVPSTGKLGRPSS